MQSCRPARPGRSFTTTGIRTACRWRCHALCRRESPAGAGDSMVTAELYGCKAPPPSCHFLFLRLGRGLHVRGSRSPRCGFAISSLCSFCGWNAWAAFVAGRQRVEPTAAARMRRGRPGVPKVQVSVRRCRQVSSRETGHGEGASLTEGHKDTASGPRQRC